MKTIHQSWALRFIPLWLGQALSLLGSQLLQFAIIWYLCQTTKSATALAIASMMGLLPQVLLSPFIGTWVNRGNRRLIFIAADSIVAALERQGERDVHRRLVRGADPAVARADRRSVSQADGSQGGIRLGGREGWLCLRRGWRRARWL